ncbi:hypothetical protein Tco_0371346 [Tanacetum coccineum]
MLTIEETGIAFASQVGVSHDLTKPVTPHSWPQVRKSSFAKPYDVNAPGPSRNSPKHVSFQSPRESVGSNDMVHNYYLEEAKKKAQLQKDKALNTKPSVQQSARLPNTANGNKPKPRNFNQQPRNWPPSMSSRVSNRTVNIAEPPRNQKPFLKSKDLACPTCKKCIYSANHDECILKYLSKVGLKWIPIIKPVETSYNTNDSASPLGKETHNPNTTICANSSSLSAGTSMASEPISSKGSSNGSMPSKIELTLEQSQQGVSNDVLESWYCNLFDEEKSHSHPYDVDYTNVNMHYAVVAVSHSAEVDSRPASHTQAKKTYYKHQDSRIKKAQELNTKTSANSDIQDILKVIKIIKTMIVKGDC